MHHRKEGNVALGHYRIFPKREVAGWAFPTDNGRVKRPPKRAQGASNYVHRLYRIDACTQIDPPLFEVGEAHASACIRAEEILAGTLVTPFERGAASTNVDVRLIELKQKMGMLPASTAPPSQRQLGKGANTEHDEETVHAEIDDTGSEKKRS